MTVACSRSGCSLAEFESIPLPEAMTGRTKRLKSFIDQEFCLRSSGTRE